MKKLFILALLMSLGLYSHAFKRKVLYIGNSYTFTNNMPAIVDSICHAFGDTVEWEMYAPGGYTFRQHSTDATTLAKIALQPWDVVILQEQSQMPSFPPSQVETDVYPYAHALDSIIRANDSCTQTMFMMTWGHANGDPGNCPSYPVICTFDGMQMRLRESYLQMGQDNHACVIPVGSAFRIMYDSSYVPWLFSADSSHPIFSGSYLEACVVYASIFHKSPYNCSYIGSLPMPDANLLQRITNKVVFDSIFQWQRYGHYPYAGFTKTLTGGDTLHVTDIVPVGANHRWTFGDGTGLDTNTSPTHVFATSGTYTITNRVSTDCFSEYHTDTVHVTVTPGSVDRVHSDEGLTVCQAGNGNITFKFDANKFESFELYNINGSLVAKHNHPSGDLHFELVKGFYTYRCTTSEGAVFTGKSAVY